MPGRFDDDHLQRRPDVRVEQVTAVCTPIRFADNDMRVQLRMSLIVLRDVSDKRDQFHLLAHWDFLVFLLVEFEEPQRGSFKRTNGRQVRADETLFGGESQQARYHFFSGVEYHRKGPLRPVLNYR